MLGVSAEFAYTIEKALIVNKYKKGVKIMGNILWTIIVVLVVLWLLGFVLQIGGGLIHTLLVIAGIIFVFQLITGRRKL